VEYDFFFMLFTIIILMFTITQTLKVFLPKLIESNIIFYMMMFILLMAFMNLTKHTFSQGYFKYADETKIEILFAMKSFIATYVLFKTFSSTGLFDFDLEKAHEESLKRVNSTMILLGGKLDFPIDFTYVVLAVFASLLTFATVKLNIRFAYYFYVL
jgi:hypothetical protein